MKKILFIDNEKELETHIQNIEFLEFEKNTKTTNEYFIESFLIKIKEPFLVYIKGFEGNQRFLCESIMFNKMNRKFNEYFLWDYEELYFYSITDKKTIEKIRKFVGDNIV